MKTLLLATFYFLAVFALGFAFGIGRVLFLEPRLSATTAELVETPFMIACIYLVAKRLVKNFRPPPRAALFAGILSLAFLLTAEVLLVLRVRGISFSDYYAERSILSLVVYSLSLLTFALMPELLALRAHRATAGS